MNSDVPGGPSGSAVIEPPVATGWSTRRRAMTVLIGLLAASMLAAAGVVVWKWRHPSAFEPYGNAGGINRWTVGETAYVGLTFPDYRDHRHVSIQTVTAHGLADGTDATVEFVLCTIDPAEGGLGAGSEADMSKSCTSVDPAAGADMAFDRQALMVALTPSQPGVFEMRGADVSYTDGWQTGTQHVGIRAWVRVNMVRERAGADG